MRKLLIALVVLIALAMLPAAVSAAWTIANPIPITVSAEITGYTNFTIYNLSTWSGWGWDTPQMDATIGFGEFDRVSPSSVIWSELTDPNNVWPTDYWSGESIGMVYSSNQILDTSTLDISINGSDGTSGNNYMTSDVNDKLDYPFQIYVNGTVSGHGTDQWVNLSASTYDVLLVEANTLDMNLPNGVGGADGSSFYALGYKFGQWVTDNDRAGSYSIILTITAEENTGA